MAWLIEANGRPGALLASALSRPFSAGIVDTVICAMQDTQTQLQAASLREARMQNDAEGTQAALAHSQQETIRLSQVSI